MRIVNPKVNYLEKPFIDRQPAISWQYESDVRGQVQSAYRITVTESDSGAAAYDTGWVESSVCSNILLDMQMRPLTPYSFTIEAKDQSGAVCTADSTFHSGKCGTKFTAKWISDECSRRKNSVHGAIYLRKEFEAPVALKRATLVICGLGFFEAHINGRQVGDEFMSTPLTAFDLNVKYRMFDVTDLLQGGDNAIGVILGNAYYNCFSIDEWHTFGAPWRDAPKLICELYMVDEQGNTTVMLSDKSWKTLYGGPITFNGLRHGESYDARINIDGWAELGFDDSSWKIPRYVRLPGGLMHVSEAEPIRVYRKFHPVRKWKCKNGWMFDTGVAQAGVSNITYHGKAGETIAIRYSDKATPDGELDQQSLNGFVKNFQFQTDAYTKRTDEPETWHARFCFHGFQFMEVAGNDWEPELEDIEIWSLCSGFPERGQFASSNDVYNQIQQLTLNSIRSVCFTVINADSVREKLCWTGDAGLSTEMLMLNYGADAFFVKFSEDIRDAQKPSGLLPCIIPTTGWGFTFANGPDWSQPIYGIPQQLYWQSGDTRTMRENYGALCRYISYLSDMSVDGISECGLGDWCAPFEGPAISVNMGGFKCPMAVTDTAYYYATVKAAEECARVLGYEDDIAVHAEHAETIRQAFRREFFDKENYIVKSDTQTSTSMMIAFGLAYDEEIPALLETLKRQIHRDNDHFDVGVLGMNALMESLGRSGNAQLAADLLAAPGYPSIKNWIDMGATSMWECWNGLGSHNHHMFGCVSSLFYKYVAGIRPLEPGYSKIGFFPMLSGHTDSAKAHINATRGMISTAWEKTDKGFTLDIEVPVSCTGEVKLPAAFAGASVLDKLTESGAPISENALISAVVEDGYTVVTVPSGKWSFEV